MKKEITILQENSSPLVVTDTDERDINTYTVDLSKLLENNNVTLLHTTSCSVIIRPHKINSIIVRELELPPQVDKSQEPKEETQQESEIEEKIEEISDDGTITD